MVSGTRFWDAGAYVQLYALILREQNTLLIAHGLAEAEAVS